MTILTAFRTRGLLEPLLTRLRARQANSLIPRSLRSGRILDIGCGFSAYFLRNTDFSEKFAIDRLDPPLNNHGIRWHVLDLNSTASLPFGDGELSVVTMLAVAEHLDPSRLCELLGEIHRTLQSGGLCILTTPSPWTDYPLRLMARTNLVNADLFGEHVYAYSLPLLGWHLGRAGFAMDSVRFGYFELTLNQWAIAKR